MATKALSQKLDKQVESLIRSRENLTGAPFEMKDQGAKKVEMKKEEVKVEEEEKKEEKKEDVITEVDDGVCRPWWTGVKEISLFLNNEDCSLLDEHFPSTRPYKYSSILLLNSLYCSYT